MSRVDERIREDLRGLTRPVRTESVLERVASKKVRRRTVRRIESAALVVAVLAGSLVAVIGLTRAFDRRGHVSPGGGPKVTAAGHSPSNPDVEGALCDESMLNADVDGDGALDEVAVWSPSMSEQCKPLPPDVGERYVLHVSGGKLAELVSPGATSFPGIRFYGIQQELPECTQPFACRLFSAPDLDGDGAQELAIQVAQGSSDVSLVFYRAEVDPEADHYALVRLSVAPPGDRWSSAFRLPPGPAVFRWGASPTEVHTISCTERQGEQVLAITTALQSANDPSRYDVHETLLRVGSGSGGQAGRLTVVETKDHVGAAPSLPADLCGAPIPRGSS